MYCAPRTLHAPCTVPICGSSTRRKETTYVVSHQLNVRGQPSGASSEAAARASVSSATAPKAGLASHSAIFLAASPLSHCCSRAQHASSNCEKTFCLLPSLCVHGGGRFFQKSTCRYFFRHECMHVCIPTVPRLHRTYCS